MSHCTCGCHTTDKFYARCEDCCDGQESEGIVVGITQGTVPLTGYDLDKFYYIIESPELLSLAKHRLTRIEGE